MKAPPKNNEMAAKLGDPINTECPLKPGRAIDPSLLALNEKGKRLGSAADLSLNVSNPVSLHLQAPLQQNQQPRNLVIPSILIAQKPGRPVDPSILAFNDDGDTVASAVSLASISSNKNRWKPPE